MLSLFLSGLGSRKSLIEIICSCGKVTYVSGAALVAAAFSRNQLLWKMARHMLRTVRLFACSTVDFLNIDGLLLPKRLRLVE